MKKVLLSLSLVAALTMVSCKEKASEKIDSSKVEMAAERDAVSKNLPVMAFDKSEHDFGVIEQGTPQETVFTFTNTGNAPLSMTNAPRSCGCTVPEDPKNPPLEPGQSGEMLVRFNGSGQNQVTKTITVSANTSKGSEMLRIKAFVTPKSGAAANALGPVK